MNARSATSWVLPWIAVVPVASAETIGWSFESGVERSDNIARTTTNELSETTALVGLALGIEAERPRLDTEIAADLQYRDYLNQVFDDELAGGLDGLLYYRIVPEWFAWSIEDNFAQIPINGRAVDVPSNRQNVNYFTTGPDFTVPLGARTAFQLSGRYSDIWYEETLEDSEVAEGSVALERRVSDGTTLALVGSKSVVRYDSNDLYSDSDVTKGFLRLVHDRGRLSATAILGYSTVELPLQEPRDGLLASLDLSIPVTARSRVNFTAGTEPATTADVLRRDQDITGIEDGRESAIASGDVFESDYVYLGWVSEFTRGSFSVTVQAARESHDIDTSRDRETYGADISIVRSLTRRMELQLGGQYYKDDFVNDDLVRDELDASIGLLWRLTGEMSVRLTFNHVKGTSNDGSQDFEENVAYLGFLVARTRTR